ncbi:MAG: acyl-CoA thioesterase [Acidimicrobiia bacterium]
MTNGLFALGPVDDTQRFAWTPSPLLLTPAGTLQGGAGLGAATAAMEAVTGRPVIWATAQYLSFASGTAPIDIDVTIEVAGHNTTQARCVVSRDGKEILTAHAALGRRDLDFAGVWCAPPAVPDPDDCPHYRFFEHGRRHIGDLAEFRLARGRQLDDIEANGGRGDGSFALWIRCWEGDHMMTVPDLTFIGDFMPLGFADAMGAPFAGNSLDNTIRVGHLTVTRWVLLSAHVQQVAHGFGYGRAELWAQDGTLLGEVSQSAVMRMHSRIRDAGRAPRH